MAKDKSKKKDLAEGFAKPSDAPAGGDGWALTSDENRGKLMLITPLRIDHVDDKFSKEPGAVKEIVVADIVVIDEKHPERSEEHDEVFVFQGYLKGALKGYIGEARVLARLRNTEDTSKKKDRGNYYWEFEDASKKDIALATEYMAAANDPLRVKKSAPKKAADEKPAKGKKSKAAAEPEPKKKGKKK